MVEQIFSNRKMSTNPFTYGKPISDPARFFGRQPEVEQIYSRLSNTEFESSSLVGERRIGKTSLLYYVKHTDIRRAHGFDPERFIFIYVDLSIVVQSDTPKRLWQWLLREMTSNCLDDQVKQFIDGIRSPEMIDNFALEDLFHCVDERGQHVVFLLDEFENVTKNQNFDADFFYQLRSLAIHHKLALVTSSRSELIELCHSDTIRASPFFNIFANINLRPFSEAEARQLLSATLEGTGIAFSEAETSALLRLAGCHPYFLQAAGHFLFDACTHNLAPQERLASLQRRFREEATPHLADFWKNSSDPEKIMLTAVAMLERKGKADGHSFSLRQLRELYSRSDQTLTHLEKRGLLVARGDALSLFNTLFGEWIISEITNTLDDHQDYTEWLKSNRGLLERLSSNASREIRDILPQIGSKYRELVITWLSDPKNVIMAAELMRGALGNL